VLNHLTGKTLALADLQAPKVVLSLIVMTLLTGLISGAYPAFVISGFRPTQALRGHGKTAQSALLRKGLVAFQFAISIFLIIGTIVVLRQLTYFRTKQLGFDKEHVIHVRLDGELEEAVKDNLETAKQELLRNPAILNVSVAADVPGVRYSLEGMSVDGHLDDERTMMRIAWGVDHDYLKTLGIELVAGRDFSREAPADTNAWIINEAAVARLGLDDPVGRVMRWDDYAGPIVGVAKNFHFASLHHEIEPLVIPLRPGIGGMLLVRIQAGQMAKALPFLERTIEGLVPGQRFRYSFVADDFDLLYRDEDTLRDVFGYFSAIAIFIACLGLFGLAAFTAEQRTKEIGVRKVLGEPLARGLRLPHRNILVDISNGGPGGPRDCMADRKLPVDPRRAGRSGEGAPVRVGNPSETHDRS
jgi:putative ABC transport system permease protein